MEHNEKYMEHIEEYAELASRIEELKAKKEALGEKILENMKESDLANIKASFGTFSKVQKLVYEYPEEYKEQERTIKDMLSQSKKAVESTLEPVVKEHLTFRAAKV